MPPKALLSPRPGGSSAGTRSTWRSPTTGSGPLGPQSPIKLLRAINGLGSMTWYNEQIIRLGAGLAPDREMKFLPAFISMQKRDKRMAEALDYAG